MGLSRGHGRNSYRPPPHSVSCCFNYALNTSLWNSLLSHP
nr:MAG TPA: hypothetical protein [Bacteriophage sp.]